MVFYMMALNAMECSRSLCVAWQSTPIWHKQIMLLFGMHYTVALFIFTLSKRHYRTSFLFFTLSYVYIFYHDSLKYILLTFFPFFYPFLGSITIFSVCFFCKCICILFIITTFLCALPLFTFSRFSIEFYIFIWSWVVACLL